MVFMVISIKIRDNNIDFASKPIGRSETFYVELDFKYVNHSDELISLYTYFLCYSIEFKETYTK